MVAEASVIVPILRQVDLWLDRSVCSALMQTTRTEVVVIVSPKTPSSNRETLERLAGRYSTLSVHCQLGEGFANALNEGIRLARTHRVGFLLSDDWLMPMAVERCLPENSDIVSTSLLTFAADGSTPIEGAHSFLKRSTFDNLKSLESKANYLSHFFLFNRDALLSVGGLDETIGDAPGIDDYDLIWTLLEHGASVSIVEEMLYCYRDHEDERLTLRSRTELTSTMMKILNKHGVRDPERSDLLKSHAIWFGKPIHVVLDMLSQLGG